MDIQLKELLEKIKDEGVKTADEKAAGIVKKAEVRASEIVVEAKKKADKLIENAGMEVQKANQTAREAMHQAARDLIINLKGQITKLFDAIIAEETKSALSGKGLEEAIVALMTAWGEKSGDVAIQLPPDQLSKIGDSIKKQLAGKIKGGVELKPFPDLEAGFRAAEKDGSAYYNFSSEGIAEILSEYLNPKLGEVLTEASTEE